MVYMLEMLFEALGVGLIIVLYLVFKSVRAKMRLPRGNVTYPYFKRRRWFRFPSRSIISSLILLTAVVVYLWGPQIRQLTGAVTPQISGQCDIKGNISASGERIYHRPGNRYYYETVIDESRGERWFCSESKAIAAGWRPAKV